MEAAKEEVEKMTRLLDLPIELLIDIFLRLDVKEVLTNCVTLCSLCHKAVMNDLAWKERCKHDLEVEEIVGDLTSWYQTYQGKSCKAIVN